MPDRALHNSDHASSSAPKQRLQAVDVDFLATPPTGGRCALLKGTKRRRGAGASTLLFWILGEFQCGGVVTKQTNDGKLVQSPEQILQVGDVHSLMGLDYRIPTLQKMFNDHIAVTSTAEQAHVDLNAAVAAQDESEAAIRPIRRALFNVVKAKLGETSSTLLEFGFKPKKVAEKTAAVKADAPRRRRPRRRRLVARRPRRRPLRQRKGVRGPDFEERVAPSIGRRGVIPVDPRGVESPAVASRWCLAGTDLAPRYA